MKAITFPCLGAQAIIVGLCSCVLQAQTCTHTITVNPDGSTVLVYRNGLLLREGLDYSYLRPVVTLKWWNAADTFSYVYDRMVSIQVPGTTVSMNEYRLNREDATCMGDNPAPAGTAFTQLNGLQIPVGAGLIALSSGPAVDVGKIATRAQVQSGALISVQSTASVQSTGGTTLYAGCPAIGADLTGTPPFNMVVLTPDVGSSSGTSQFDYCATGPLTIKTPTGGDPVLLPGVPYLLIRSSLVQWVVESSGGSTLARKICTGSGTITSGSPPATTGWNCAGLEYYAFTLPDGSIVDYVATPATQDVRASVAMGPPMWTSVPLP